MDDLEIDELVINNESLKTDESLKSINYIR